ncbi:MAG: hypothetical protein GX275_04945 [Clostridiales bacterium]|nr:hypothetical protein [Clostridiales bacterium]
MYKKSILGIMARLREQIGALVAPCVGLYGTAAIGGIAGTVLRDIYS